MTLPKGHALTGLRIAPRYTADGERVEDVLIYSYGKLSGRWISELTGRELAGLATELVETPGFPDDIYKRVEGEYLARDMNQD